MRRRLSVKNAFFAVGLLFVLIALLAAPAFAEDGEEAVGRFYGTAWALFPPVVAIVLALLTKEVYSSLFIGILAGAFMYADFNIPGMIVHTIEILSSRIGGNAGIIVFNICLGVIVAMLAACGCAKSFGEWASTKIRSKRTSLLSTTVLGVFFCIDDYFNALTIGQVMRPITDKHKVSRARLAYNVDCTAAPICIIAPISSWAAAVASYVPPEVEADGYSLFLRCIPFNMYALLTLTMLITLAVIKFDFGPMRGYEYLAEVEGDIYGGTGNCYDHIAPENDHPRGKPVDMILPVAVLIVACIYGLIYTGGVFEGAGLIEAFSS